jgi:PAS domain S-box-containing protein
MVTIVGIEPRGEYKLLAGFSSNCVFKGRACGRSGDRMDSDDIARAALQNLAEVRRALSLERSGAPLREVATALLRAARLYAADDAGTALLLVNEGGGRLKLLTSCGLSERCAAILDEMPIRLDSLPCGRAASLGEKVLVNDLSLEQHRPDYRELTGQEGIRACWSFPVQDQGRNILGTLAVYFRGPQQADGYRLEMMEFIAQCAALTVERSREAEQRRDAETQLRESESRYRSLTRVLTSVVWTADPEGRFLAPQEAWEKYTGQGWEQQQGFGWFAAIHPEDRESVLAEVLRAQQTRHYYRADTRIWHEASQRHRHCEVRGLPVLSADGAVVEWIGTCVDMDDQKQAEEALRLADRRKDEFIAVLAHELRNPLAPIRNAVHILKVRGKGDAQLSWASTIIDRQVAQMARLLDDLLDVSRIASNKLELRKARVTLDSILETALETSRPLLEQHGHQFELNVLSGPVYVEADSVRLAQVFSNLLNNAAKYTDRGGKIILTVRVQGQEVLVSVKDNGIGIEREMLPRLFHMFSQASPALERAQGGLGIGLSLVRGLVEMHGGTVEAFSEGPGRGSEFVAHLPLAPMRADHVALQASSRPSAAPMRILVADDNRDSAETLSVFLQMMGHEVRTAADGQEAVELAASFRPRVALLDIGMPKVNGYDAAARMRSLLPGLVLIATTGWGQQDDRQKATAAGFDHHLVKPTDPDLLCDLLAGLDR